MTIKNVIVVGGSYSGAKAARELAKLLPAPYRVVLLEKRSHFTHLYVLPRFAVIPGYEDHAFIPYDHLFDGAGHHRAVYIQATVKAISANEVTYQRHDREESEVMPYTYLVYAAGSRLPVPLMKLPAARQHAVLWLKGYQERIASAQRVVVAGGGALGIQFASDIKAWFPEKHVLLINSRPRFLPLYEMEMHHLIQEELEKLGVEVLHNERLVIEPEQWPETDEMVTLRLQSGRSLQSDLPILCLGLRHNHELISTFCPEALDGKSSALRVMPTLQLDVEHLRHIFVIGDVAKTGSIKAGHTGYRMAEVAVHNILKLIDGQSDLQQRYEPTPPRIKITLGKRVAVSQSMTDAGETVISRTETVKIISMR